MKRLVLGALVAIFSVTSAFAAQFGTKAEAMAMIDRAVQLFEAEGIDALTAAAMDPDNTDFRDRDLYVFVNQMEGQFIAHGVDATYVGTDIRGIKDASGDMMGLRVTAAAQTGEPNWVDYIWFNPVTYKQERKSSYIVPLSDEYFIGVGIYTEHQPE